MHNTGASDMGSSEAWWLLHSSSRALFVHMVILLICPHLRTTPKWTFDEPHRANLFVVLSPSLRCKLCVAAIPTKNDSFATFPGFMLLQLIFRQLLPTVKAAIDQSAIAFMLFVPLGLVMGQHHTTPKPACVDSFHTVTFLVVLVSISTHLIENRTTNRQIVEANKTFTLV